MTYSKPVPNVNDPQMGPFWQAALQHRLTAQQCTSCKTLRFPALPICPSCLEQGDAWVDVSPEGTIWSFATYHRAFHPGFKGDLPYVVGIVEIADGLSYVGRIEGSRESVKVGATVRVDFVDATDEFALPIWRVVED